MSRSKKAGTAWESEVVARARSHDLDAARHPEGGSLDHGDVWIRVDRLGESPSAIHFDVECKVTQNGTPHAWLSLQALKARDTAIPVVAWKRLTLTTETNVRRTSRGALAILYLDDLLDLLAALEKGSRR